MESEAAYKTVAIERMHETIIVTQDTRSVEEKSAAQGIGKLAVNKLKLMLVYFDGVP